MNAFRRLMALVRKELQALLRDPEGRKLLIAPIVLQLLLFPFAATMEVRNVGVVVYDEDGGVHARELTDHVTAAEAFSGVTVVRDAHAFQDALDRQDALVGLRFAPGFSADIAAGRPAMVQAITDGRKSSGAGVALGYVNEITGRYAREIRPASGAPEVTVRHVYNPNLDQKWFIVPSLIAIATALGFLVVTALSVAREHEQGTLDQLRVSPLTTGQIMAGKAIPAIAIAFVQGTIILLGAILGYGVPFSGAWLALYAGMLCYGLSTVACGLLISTVCRTQQQAVLGVFCFIVPAVLLSGFVSPVENMPQWLQWATWINPVRHFTDFIGIVYLKGIDLGLFIETMAPLLTVAALALAISWARFRTAIE
jgi:ABC-2 type transport system permease protein